MDSCSRITFNQHGMAAPEILAWFFVVTAYIFSFSMYCTIWFVEKSQRYTCALQVAMFEGALRSMVETLKEDSSSGTKEKNKAESSSGSEDKTKTDAISGTSAV